MSHCPACTRGPQGAEGHLDLFVFRMQGSQMQFTCRTCSTLWLRTATDDGYRWSEAKSGLEAPGMPGRDEPRR